MMDHMARSGLFWTPRVILTVVAIAYIACDNMTTSDVIMNIPVEYVPSVFLATILAALFITFVRGIFAFSEEYKKQARTMGIRIKYGLDYLSKNIGVAVCVAICSIVALGVFYSLTGLAPKHDDCMAIGFGVAMIIAWGGEAVANKILESIRNFSKGNAAIDEKEAQAASAPVVKK